MRRIRVKIEHLCGVRLVEERIIGDIVHNIRVVYLRSTVLRRHKKWKMFDIVFLGSM